MGSPEGERSSGDESATPKVQTGQRVKIEGIMTPMEVKSADDQVVALGPNGGLYELVETSDGLRARSGTSTRHAELVSGKRPAWTKR